MTDVTELLARWNRGDRDALAELMPLVYAELHRLAEHYMRLEQADHTLQPTALVHEAYLRLAGANGGRFNNRVHFYGAAAQAMRRILVDHARRHNVKRGRGVPHVPLDETAVVGDHPGNLVALDDALTELARIDARKAHVVELRFFGGLSVEETAQVLKVSPVTVRRDWSSARVWLYRELIGPTLDGPGPLEAAR